MISVLTGKLAVNGGQYAVIDCGGVGYFVSIPGCVGRALPQPGEVCTLFTILNITKTDLSLVGFLSQEQRKCYQMLTSVSGAGMKAGLEILGALDVQMVNQAIISENVEMLTQIKGIGKKLAHRIILECRDRVEQENCVAGTSDHTGGANIAVLSAVEALVSLGYKQKEAMSAVAGIDPTLPLETILSQALKKCSI